MQIYLDHAATSQVRPEVIEAIQPYLTDPARMGNPSSLHARGRKAADVLSKWHDRVAKIFNCRHDDVIFNSGGSEGDTHVLFGVALLLGRPVHVVVSAIEHKAVLNAAERLTAMGHRMTTIPVNPEGVVELDAIEQLIRTDRPDLVSVMAVNNETGVVQPIDAIARLCIDHGVLFHSDAVQAVGHGFSEILSNRDIHFLTISGHKFGGLRGTGLLIQRQKLVARYIGYGDKASLPALICGGSQEHGCRAGTENVAGVVGLVKALELSEDPRLDEAGNLLRLRTQLEVGLRRVMPDSAIHGEYQLRAPHITSIAFPGCLGRDLLKQLDRKGICVGLGSACTGCSNKVSHVLKAMHVPDDLAEATLRFSLGWSTTGEEIGSNLEIMLNLLRVPTV